MLTPQSKKPPAVDLSVIDPAATLLWKTYTFWTGIATIVTGIGMIMTGQDKMEALQTILLGLGMITGRKAIATLGKSMSK